MTDNPLIRTVVLANPQAIVPWPGVPGRMLPAEPFTVSVIDPFFAALIADRSLVSPPEPAAEKPAKTKS
jgi:hypothetical protein